VLDRKKFSFRRSKFFSPRTILLIKTETLFFPQQNYGNPVFPPKAPVLSVLAWCAGARGAHAPIAGAGISAKRTAPESDPDKRSQLKGTVS
jgi:hypothetical protein